ncbi:hypothetical protein KSS87_004699 [Heliosperma pusillum]|nr:hypothetical protein KSS87_004699 [Heliosperma pusillum]
MAKFEDLEDNNNNNNNGNNNGYYLYGEQEDEEEEDLSMVSDASSGPPHFDHDIDEEKDNDDLCYNNGGRLRKQCMKSNAHESHYCANNMENDFALDDTASSHVFTSKKIGGIHVQNHQNASFERLIGYSSQGYSATHFQVGLNSSKSTRQQDLGHNFSSN